MTATLNPNVASNPGATPYDFHGGLASDCTQCHSEYECGSDDSRKTKHTRCDEQHVSNLSFTFRVQPHELR